MYTLADHLGSVKRKGKHDSWGMCATSAECKTDISAVLTVKSGLDPHMIIELEDGFKSWLWLCHMLMVFSLY